jgi:hypothetical protein
MRQQKQSCVGGGPVGPPECDDGLPFSWVYRLLKLGVIEMPKTLYDTEPMKVDTEILNDGYFYKKAP